MSWSQVDSGLGNYASANINHAVTFPLGAPAEGDLIVLEGHVHTNLAVTPPAGFSTKVNHQETFRTLYIFYKIAGPSESDTHTCTLASSQSGTLIGRVFNSTTGWAATQDGGANYTFDGGTVGTVTVSSAMTAGSLAVAMSYTSNTTAANKRYAVAESWLDPIFAATNRGAGAYKEAAAGTNSATFEFTDATTNNRMAVGIAEFLVAAGGPTVSSITDPIIGTNAVTIVLSEAAPTVNTVQFTVGTVTQTQAYSTGDYTTHTIPAPTRNLLPPIGTVTVELKAGATVIATTTATLQQPAGYDAVTGAGVDDSLAAPHTGVLSNSDIAEVSDVGNTVLDPGFLNFAQTIPRPFTVRVWDASEELWGVSSFFTVDGGEDSPVIGSIINSVIIQSIIS